MPVPVRTVTASRFLALFLGLGVLMLAAAIHPTQATGDIPVSYPGLDRLFRFNDSLWCGSMPRGDAGHATLQQLGVQTVISVDGAVPDVDAMDRHDLRIIHIPMTYGRPTSAQVLQLAAAVHDAGAEHPVYVHCHHGRHRCAAAAAIASVALGHDTPRAATQRMHACGTSPRYTNLWEAVADMQPVPSVELEQVTLDFPRAVPPLGMVASMIKAEETLEQFKSMAPGTWTTKQAGDLAELFRMLAFDSEIEHYPGSFADDLEATRHAAAGLEEALDQPGLDPSRALGYLSRIEASCTSCHRAHRN